MFKSSVGMKALKTPYFDWLQRVFDSILGLKCRSVIMLGPGRNIKVRMIAALLFPLLFTTACSIHTAITSLSSNAVDSSVKPTPEVLNPLYITSSKLSSSVEESDLSFAGVGGYPPFTFQLTQGLGSLMSGTQLYVPPAGLNKQTIRVQVTDSAGQSAEKTIVVNGFDSLSLWESAAPAHHAGKLAMNIITSSNTWVVKNGTNFSFSTDSGATWIHRPVNLDIKNSTIFGVDPVRSLIYLTGKSGYSWKVYKSSDLALSWSLIDNYGTDLGGPETNIPLVIFVHPTTGLVLVGGQSVPAANLSFSSYGKAYVRRSADFGATWTESDFFSEMGPMSSYWGAAQHIVMGPDGAIYHAGYIHWSTDTLGNPCICDRPYIRKSADNGLSWTALTPFMRSSSYGGTTSVISTFVTISVSAANTITAVMQEQVFSLSQNFIYFRQSTDGGTTWASGTDLPGSLPDIFQADPISTDIYRYKLDSLSAYTSRWILDKTSNLGASFTAVENYSENINSSTLNSPTRMFFTATDMFLLGIIYDTNNLSVGLIRQYVRSGGQSNVGRFSAEDTAQAGSINSILATSTGYDLGGSWGGAKKFGLGKFTVSSNTLVNDEYFSFNSNEYSYTINEASKLNGNTYIAAKTNDSVSTWLVRQRNDTTGVWTAKDSYVKSAGYKSKAASIVKSGTRYIACGGAMSSGNMHFVIRTSASNDDTSWSTTLETTNTSFAIEGGCTRLGVNPVTGDVYATGARTTGFSNYLEMYVYKSTDSGLNWTQVDRVNVGFLNYPTDIAFKSTGEIMITVNSGIVRSSSNNGSTWANETIATGAATSIFIDSSDTAWVTLNSTGKGSVYRKIVGGSWQEYYFKTGASFFDFLILPSGTKTIVGSAEKPLLIEFRK